MDYEKKYNGALERAKNYYSTTDSVADTELIELIFPELKEKEMGEKIKRCLINGMKFYYEEDEKAVWGTEKFSMKVKDIIAWLEKQGEQKPIINVPTREVIISIWDLGNEWKELTNGSISTEYGTQLDYIQKHWHESEYYLREKQGEQKVPVIDFKAKDWYVSKVDGKIRNIYHSVDKVEPKFKVGDWVIDKQGIVHQIANVIEIVTCHTYGYDVVGGGYFNDNTEGVRLWTIQDAKDGDVLQLGEVTAIFKKYIGQEKCICYCSVCEGEFEIPIENGEDNIYGCTNTTPATKEQRDTLMKAITDAGYEWDAEKKELKLLIANGGDFSETENCGQKPVEWKQENREELTEFENAMMHIGGSFFGENAGLDPNDTETIKEQAKLLLELAPKTEWSEEDENILQWIVTDIKQLKNYNKKSDAIVNKEFALLESIKQRYTWKPNSEQLYILNWLATNVLGDGVVDKKASEILYTLYDDLKKL